MVMTILVLYGPNLNLLGLVSRGTGTRLTLDRLDRSLRQKARELGVELKIYQDQSEAEASKIVRRMRNRVDGILLLPAVWARCGHLLLETVALVGLPLAVFHFEPEPGPWRYADESLFRGTSLSEDRGSTPGQLAAFLADFIGRLK
jgi:3-dehydroquinate dehydratase